MTTQSESAWTTAEGERIPFSKVTHQHWSNIYWYHKIFENLPGMNPLLMHQTSTVAFIELNKNFNGEILPWKPVFDYELNWLKTFHLLKENEIWVFGEKIGSIDPSSLKHVPGIKLYPLN